MSSSSSHGKKRARRRDTHAHGEMVGVALFVAALSVMVVAVGMGLFSCVTHRGGTLVVVLACVLLFISLELWLLYVGSNRQDLVGLVVLLALSGVAATAVVSSVRGVVDDDGEGDEANKTNATTTTLLPPVAGAFMGGFMSLVVMLFAVTYFLWPLSSVAVVMATTLVVEIAAFTFWAAWRVNEARKYADELAKLPATSRLPSTSPRELRPSVSLWATAGISLAMNRGFVVASTRTTSNVQFLVSMVLVGCVVVYAFVSMWVYTRWLRLEEKEVEEARERDKWMDHDHEPAVIVVEGVPVGNKGTGVVQAQQVDSKGEWGVKTEAEKRRVWDAVKTMRWAVLLVVVLLLVMGGVLATYQVVSPRFLSNVVMIVVIAVLVVVFVVAVARWWTYEPESNAQRVGRMWRAWRFGLVVPFLVLFAVLMVVGMVKFDDAVTASVTTTNGVDDAAVQGMYGVMALMSALAYCAASLALFRYYFYTMEGTVLLVVVHVVVVILVGGAVAVLTPSPATMFLYVVEVTLALGELGMVVISCVAFVSLTVSAITFPSRKNR